MPSIPYFRAAALLAAAACAGCAAVGGAPVAGFDGSWTIAKRGMFAGRAGTLTRAAEREAAAHCAAAGKRYRQIEVMESPAGLLSPHAESTLTFACD